MLERSSKLKLQQGLTLCTLVLLTACAGDKATNGPPAGYVEIDNPGYTMSPGASPTIWVPRSYVESGPPRGSELVKEGIAKAKEAVSPQSQPQLQAQPQPQRQGVPTPAVQQQASLPMPAAQPIPASVQLKSRIAVLETGENGLLLPFSEKVRSAAVGVLLDPSQPAMLTKYATITNQAERGAFAVRLQQEYGTTVVVFVGAPDGVAPGKTIQAEIYDGMGGELLRRVSATIPPYVSSDPAARATAVGTAMTELTGTIKEVVGLIPWYGKVAAVEGDRAYINAGKEAGLRIGQILKIYRGGKVVAGLGFAPGNRVGSLEVNGFVGPNGAFGVIRESQGVQASDLVSVE